MLYTSVALLCQWLAAIDYSSYIKLKAPSAQECERFAAIVSKTLNTKMNVSNHVQLNDQTSNAGGETCHVFSTLKGSGYGDPHAFLQAMLKQSDWKEDKQNTNMFYPPNYPSALTGMRSLAAALRNRYFPSIATGTVTKPKAE